MKKRVLSLLLVLCLSLGLLPAGALAAGTQTVKTAVTVDYGAAIEAVEYLNQLRREAGLPDLVMDENLVKSAITRASECSVYYSHTRPSGEGYPTACPSDSRYPSSTYSENILWGTAKVSPQRATQTWRDSPLHYANMMNKNHRSVGIACVYARDGKSYWVQTFSSATAQVDPNPLTGTANLTFSVPVAPEMITPHVETSSYTVQMHDPQDVFVFNDKSPVVPDILRSADESVVKVSLADTAVRLTAVGPGSTTVTVGFGGKTITLSVTVPEFNNLEEIVLTEPAGGFNLKVGESLTTRVKFLPEGVPSVPVTWSVDYPERVSLSTQGSSCTVTAKKPTGVTLTATVTHPNTGVRLQAYVRISIQKADQTVTDPTSVTISPSPVFLKVGGKASLSAWVTPSTASQAVTWRSSNTSVATVTQSGQVTAVGEGVATIYATTADGKASGSCRVTVSKSSQGPHSFTDVSQSDYFYDAVMWCADQGLLDDAGNTVGVYTPCTRAEMVYHLWQLAGSPEPITSINAFSDLSSLSTQERKAIRWAVEENITNGTSITTFSPSMVLTRAQVVTFLYRVAGRPSVAGSAGFSDVPQGNWFANAAVWAVKEGITTGTTATTFTPDRTCVRSEVFTFLYRYYN